ncbi:MAG: hypothetical protein HKN16_01670 [Saprospiraceae bacterium]|nr:hypothetical protein [Saprospiraceae bacterium]
MPDKQNWIWIFAALALVTLVFLLYSFFNMEKLGIDNLHPRVFVELIFFLIFVILSIYYYLDIGKKN